MAEQNAGNNSTKDEGTVINLNETLNETASTPTETSNELPCFDLPVTTMDEEGNLHRYEPCKTLELQEQPSQSFNSTADKEFGLTEEGEKLKDIIGTFTPGDNPVPAHPLPDPLLK